MDGDIRIGLLMFMFCPPAARFFSVVSYSLRCIEFMNEENLWMNCAWNAQSCKLFRCKAALGSNHNFNLLWPCRNCPEFYTIVYSVQRIQVCTQRFSGRDSLPCCRLRHFIWQKTVASLGWTDRPGWHPSGGGGDTRMNYKKNCGWI